MAVDRRSFLAALPAAAVPAAALTATPPPAALPPDPLDRLTPEQRERNRRMADGPTNRHLCLLAGVLRVARDIASRTKAGPEWGRTRGDEAGYGWGDQRAMLDEDLGGIAWQLGLAEGLVSGLTVGDDFEPDGDSHADDLEALMKLAEGL